MLIYVDETAKNHQSERRRTFLSRRGSRESTRKSAHISSNYRYSMLACADINGFVLEACELVQHKTTNDPDPTHGTVDRERFKLWVETKLVPQLGDYANNEPRSVVIMDNASLHRHDQDIVDMIEATGTIIRFLPPYRSTCSY